MCISVVCGLISRCVLSYEMPVNRPTQAIHNKKLAIVGYHHTTVHRSLVVIACRYQRVLVLLELHVTVYTNESSTIAK